MNSATAVRATLCECERVVPEVIPNNVPLRVDVLDWLLWARHWSLSEVSRRTEIHRNTLSSVWRGEKVASHVTNRLAIVFGVSHKDLIDWDSMGVIDPDAETFSQRISDKDFVIRVYNG